MGLNLENANRKIKHSNLIESPIFRPFYVGQSESRRQEMRRYCFMRSNDIQLTSCYPIM